MFLSSDRRLTIIRYRLNGSAYLVGANQPWKQVEDSAYTLSILLILDVKNIIFSWYKIIEQ